MTHGWGEGKGQAKQKLLIAASRFKGVLRYQSCNSSKTYGLAPSQRVTRGSESGCPPSHSCLPSPPQGANISKHLVL